MRARVASGRKPIFSVEKSLDSAIKVEDHYFGDVRLGRGHARGDREDKLVAESKLGL
jgi:hypothetical protein